MRPAPSRMSSGITLPRDSSRRSNIGRTRYIGGALLGSVFALALVVTALLTGSSLASPVSHHEKGAANVSQAPIGGTSTATQTSLATQGSSTPTADTTPLVTPTATPFCSLRFTVVTSPNVSDATYNNLYGVSALAPDGVWAVGTSGGSTFFGRTLVQHWAGTQWSIIPSPNPLESGSSVL